MHYTRCYLLLILNIMNTINTIFLILGMTLLVFSFLSIFILFGNWKYYKPRFKEITNSKFYRNKTQIYIINSEGECSIDFVWFIYKSDFQLTPSVYLHNTFFTYFDPYSLYWLLKYRNWFKNNVNIEDVELY